MLPLMLLLASSLLEPQPDEAMALMPLLRPYILAVALHEEIIDPRECRYYLNASYPIADLDALRNRRKKFRDAPMLHEALHLPSIKEIQARTAFATEFAARLQLETKLGFIESHILRRVNSDAQIAKQFWSLAYDARCPYYYVSVKREALMAIVKLLGERRFFHGDWPDHVPYQHFQRIP